MSWVRRLWRIASGGTILLASLLAGARPSSAQNADAVTIHGTVLNPVNHPVGDAAVVVKQHGTARSFETKSDVSGAFIISIPRTGSYTAIAEKSGFRSREVTVVPSSAEAVSGIRLQLEEKSTAMAAPDAGMEFADKPNFTVAGVVDWTAVGGHGSDATLRTSESLARETVALKPGEAEHKPVKNAEADRHRIAGEQAEKKGDPLVAVHEFEHAVQIQPSEENYFAWGSELLLHRAVWQAQEVFGKAAAKFPTSARIQTGLGTALFAGAHYEEAATSFCEASDLNPRDSDTYTLLGKVELAAPAPLPCVDKKLEQYATTHPENALANYFYAMAILKRQEYSANPEAQRQVDSLLAKAVAADNKCGDAFFQLGILSLARHDLDKAIAYYQKAIEANPELGEAHYRLGVAYDRKGESAKAQREFQVHDEIEKQQADAIEQQRRELKQFLVVLQSQPGAGQTN